MRKFLKVIVGILIIFLILTLIVPSIMKYTIKKDIKEDYRYKRLCQVKGGNFIFYFISIISQCIFSLRPFKFIAYL